MTRGICRNAGCPNAESATPLERYPGPGRYCPHCGDELAELPEPLPRPEPLRMLEALQQLDAPPAAAPPRLRRRIPRYAAVALALALAAGGTVALHPAAVGRPDADALHVCRSSLSERFASDIVQAYRRASGANGHRIDLTAPGARCDVRFWALWGDDAAGNAVVGRDGIVVVVNPQNPLARLTVHELRQILTGAIADWSQLGGEPGPIRVLIPGQRTDEGNVLVQRFLFGAPLGRNVERVGSTAAVVSAVAGPRGRTLLGIAAFSAAVPAKVVALGTDPPPSALTIAQQRYPLTVAIEVDVAGALPPAEASDIVGYARSDVAQALVAKEGLIPAKGY